jgi:hypothetical protein
VVSSLEARQARSSNPGIRQINPKAEKSATRLGNIFLLKTLHHSHSSQVHLKKCEIPF